jgi:NAD(P)-dependent dehydrogenase (short-subunit alcohol dehydrogenase family)
MSGKRVALVTGGSRGIGLAVARRLAAEFDVTISARSGPALDAAAADLRSRGTHVETVRADMAAEEDLLALAQRHLERFAALDVLVLCAGTGSAGELAGYPMRRFDKQFAVNVRAAFLLVQHLLPALRKSGASGDARGAKIIALASITGVVAEPDLAAYGASKAALISLCEAITVAECRHGLTATAISPGYVDTDMTAWVRDEIDPDMMIRPADIAEIAYCVTQLSRWSAVPNIVVTRPGAQLWRP